MIHSLYLKTYCLCCLQIFYSTFDWLVVYACYQIVNSSIHGRTSYGSCFVLSLLHIVLSHCLSLFSYSLHHVLIFVLFSLQLNVLCFMFAVCFRLRLLTFLSNLKHILRAYPLHPHWYRTHLQIIYFTTNHTLCYWLKIGYILVTYHRLYD